LVLSVLSVPLSGRFAKILELAEWREGRMLNGWLAWLIGLPSLLIVVLWLTGYLR